MDTTSPEKWGDTQISASILPQTGEPPGVEAIRPTRRRACFGRGYYVWRIAQDADNVSAMTAQPLIPVSVSARHVHLTESSIATLFGTGHVLQPHAALSQPGQFAAEETVTLIGPRGSVPHVRVVGPARHEDQVEISRTDEIALGLDAPVRLSGELGHTPGITLLGPAGRLRLDHGVVLAQRHIHMNHCQAAALGLHDRQRVEVAVGSPERELIFKDVVVRVSPDYQLELHLDTDEGNAAEVRPGDRAVLLRSSDAGSSPSPPRDQLLQQRE